MQNPTEEEIKKIDDTNLVYRKSKTFFHCRNCIEQFKGSPLHESMTPREYGIYEASSYDFTYPDGTVAEIYVVWCRRCGRDVWDSRDLTKLY